MIITLEEHKIFLKKLLAANIGFILIGDYAVNYYGYNRPTGDMDVWLNPTNDNRDKLLDLFEAEGYDRNTISTLRKRILKNLSYLTLVSHQKELTFLPSFPM